MDALKVTFLHFFSGHTYFEFNGKQVKVHNAIVYLIVFWLVLKLMRFVRFKVFKNRGLAKILKPFS